MEKKVFRGHMTLKEDGEQGGFKAVFATLNVKDADGDVTLPGAFSNGEKVRIAHWGHGWNSLPVGRGKIHAKGDDAYIEGRFFLDTQTGKEHYTTVKNLGELQEWSYGFDILDHAVGDFEGKKVRFLKKLKVVEVSPVMLGAGVDTRTVDIKGIKPYPNEHACRLREPGDFQADSFRRSTRDHEGKKYDVIMGKVKGEDAMSEQAYRYPKDSWDAPDAKAHCEDHDGSFEPAATSEEAEKDRKAGSLDDQLRKIEAAFRDQFPDLVQWDKEPHAFLGETFGDYVVVNASGMEYPSYRVTYTRQADGGIEFQPQDAWVGGDMVFAQGVKSLDRPKVGARHTGKEFETIQQMHDLAVELGAKCAEFDGGEGEGNSDNEGEVSQKGDKPNEGRPSTFAARVAMELLEN